jgi:hypothetical protein
MRALEADAALQERFRDHITRFSADIIWGLA